MYSNIKKQVFDLIEARIDHLNEYAKRITLPETSGLTEIEYSLFRHTITELHYIHSIISNLKGSIE